MDYKKLSRVVDSLNNELYNEFIKLIDPFKLVDEPLVAKSSKGSYAALQVYMPDNGRFNKDTKSLKLVLKDGWKDALVKAGWHLMDEDSYNAMMKGQNLSLPFIKSSDLKNIFKKGVNDRAFLDAEFPKEIKANTTYVPDSVKFSDEKEVPLDELQEILDHLLEIGLDASKGTTWGGDPEIVIQIPKDLDSKDYRAVEEYVNSLQLMDWFKENGFEDWYISVDQFDEEMAGRNSKFLNQCMIEVKYDMNDYSGWE